MIYDRPKWRTIQGNTAEYRMGVSFRRQEHNFGKVQETGSARKSRGVRALKNKRKKAIRWAGITISNGVVYFANVRNDTSRGALYNTRS